MITISNYEKYQGFDDYNNKADNIESTKVQQSGNKEPTTNNNDNNDNNDKNDKNEKNIYNML